MQNGLGHAHPEKLQPDPAKKLVPRVRARGADDEGHGAAQAVGVSTIQSACPDEQALGIGWIERVERLVGRWCGIPRDHDTELVEQEREHVGRMVVAVAEQSNDFCRVRRRLRLIPI